MKIQLFSPVLFEFLIEIDEFKCYHNTKAYISYHVPSAYKSKTYKYIYDSEIHAFNYNN